jgi:hypothetical protein
MFWAYAWVSPLAGDSITPSPPKAPEWIESMWSGENAAAAFATATIVANSNASCAAEVQWFLMGGKAGKQL